MFLDNRINEKKFIKLCSEDICLIIRSKNNGNNQVSPMSSLFLSLTCAEIQVQTWVADLFFVQIIRIDLVHNGRIAFMFTHLLHLHPPHEDRGEY